MNATEKDALIKELKSQIRELKEKVSISNPDKLDDLPEVGFGVYVHQNKYFLAELSFNAQDMVAKVNSVREIDKNPKSYSILRLRLNEYLNLKVLPKIKVITA